MECAFRKSPVYAFLIFALVLAVGIMPASAQVSKGSISGTVLDPSGAAVVGAQVKATNAETSQSFTTTSDATGSFKINLLPTGSYKIEVKKESFRTTTMSNVGVSVSSDTAVGGVKLELGTTAETVEVMSTAPIIESTQAQVTNTFSGVELTSLPGIQENQGLDNLAVLLPGVVGSRDLGFSNTNGGGGFSVNGLRGRNNDQEIDGQNNNDNSVGGPGVFLSNAEFAEQYQIVTSNFGPEYGRNSGSVVNIITKSGTNTWHGAIKGTESNSALNSLSNLQRAPSTSTAGSQFTGTGLGLTKVPHFNDSFVTATIGGPLVKNHAFLFAGYDTEINSSTNLFKSGLSTPTPAGLGQLAGCYTSAASQASIAALTKFGPYGIGGGNPTPVNPSVDTATFFGSSPTTGNPFPGFVPNDPVNGTCDVEMGGVQRLLPNGTHAYDWITKLDIPTGKETISIRYLWQKLSFFNQDSFDPGSGAASGYPNNVPSTGQQLAMDWTHQISNHMVNDLRLTYGRLRVEFGGNTIGNTVPHQGQLEDAVTRVIFSDPTALGYGPETNAPQGRIVNTYQIQDNWQDVVGKHTFKAGVNFTYQRSPNLFLPSVNGQYRFDSWNEFAGNEPNRIRVALGNDNLDFREHDTFAYVGDDFKVTSNLTLNLGVTYTYYGQPANLFHTQDLKQQTGSNPFWDPTLPQSVTVQPNIPSPKNSWGPGIGFAYSPQWGGFLTGNGKTVFRGGYRLSYDPPYYNIYLNMASAAPQVLLQSLSRGTASLNPLPAVPLGPNVRSALSAVLTPGVFDPRLFNSTNVSPNFRPDKVHQWSFGIQRELGAHAAVEASYVGNHGYDLFQSRNGNPDISLYPANQLPSGVTPCANSFVPNVPVAGRPDDTGRLDCNAPAILRTRDNGGYSNYHSLQTQFRTNSLFNQLTMKANYSFAKTLDNVSEIFSTFAGGGSLAFAQNPLDTKKGEYGISGLDFRHTFTLAAYEALPFFKTQQGVVGHVLGGWGLSGTYIWQSGQPYTPSQLEFSTLSGGVDDFFFNGTFIGTDDTVRPFYGNRNAPATSVGAYAGDVCNFLAAFGISGDPSCSLAPTTLLDWTPLNRDFNDPLAATLTENQVSPSQVKYILNGPTAGSVFGTPFGNVGRNQVRDSISNTTNLEVSKNVKWGERVNITWHMSLVNAFNHPNYGYNLGGADGAGTFGGIDPFVDVDAGLSNRAGAAFGFADPKVFDGGHRTIRFGLRIGF